MSKWPSASFSTTWQKCMKENGSNLPMVHEMVSTKTVYRQCCDLWLSLVPSEDASVYLMYVHASVCVCVCVHACMWVQVRVCVCTCKQAYASVCVCACVHVCVCVYVCVLYVSCNNTFSCDIKFLAHNFAIKDNQKSLHHLWPKHDKWWIEKIRNQLKCNVHFNKSNPAPCFLWTEFFYFKLAILQKDFFTHGPFFFLPT